jgi:hypothetical protein
LTSTNYKDENIDLIIGGYNKYEDCILEGNWSRYLKFRVGDRYYEDNATKQMEMCLLKPIIKSPMS